MQKIGALDANFFYNETARSPAHVASVQIFELPEQVSGKNFHLGVQEYLGRRLHLVPYLARKPLFVPGNFDHPFWVYDKNFDINNHVQHRVLPAPGSQLQLESLVAEIHSETMSRDRPMWKIVVIEGLEDGHIAFYNQVHHACLDGMAAQAATMILFDDSPNHPDVQLPEQFPPQDAVKLEDVLRLSLQNFFNFQISTSNRLLGSLEATTRLGQRFLDPSRSFGAAGKLAPKTQFNQSIEQARSYAMGDFPLADLKNIGKLMGCTLNDVFMAVCAGGLRRYLERNEQLPEQPLLAGCPVSLRKPGDKSTNNQVTMMSVSLETQQPDSRKRLLAIRDSAITAKEVVADTSAGFDPDVALPGLPGLMISNSRMAESLNLADRLPTPVNLIISNVPGPRNQLYCNEAKMLTHYPVSIPAHGVGLNITVSSYINQLYFGITACAKALPDADLLRDDLIAEYRDLKRLILGDVTNLPARPKVETQEVEHRQVA